MPRRLHFGGLRHPCFPDRGLLLIVGAFGFLGFSSRARWPTRRPQPVDRQVTLAVAALLKREHCRAIRWTTRFPSAG